MLFYIPDTLLDVYVLSSAAILHIVVCIATALSWLGLCLVSVLSLSRLCLVIVSSLSRGGRNGRISKTCPRTARIMDTLHHLAAASTSPQKMIDHGPSLNQSGRLVNPYQMVDWSTLLCPVIPHGKAQLVLETARAVRSAVSSRQSGEVCPLEIAVHV